MGGNRPLRPKWCRTWKAHPSCYKRALRGSGACPMSQGESVLQVNLERGLWTSRSHSPMPLWLPFCVCREGTAIARTILIFKLRWLKLDPSSSLSNVFLYLVPQFKTWHPTHLPAQTRNSSITLGTSLLAFSYKSLIPVKATSSVALKFAHLLPLRPPTPESRQVASPAQTVASAS